MTKLLTLGILFSTAIRAVIVAKLVILGISFIVSFILTLGVILIVVLRVALIFKLVISGILSSMFLVLALYTSFLTTSFFPTSLSLLKSTGTGTNLSLSNLSTLLLKLLKLVG